MFVRICSLIFVGTAITAIIMDTVPIWSEYRNLIVSHQMDLKKNIDNMDLLKIDINFEFEIDVETHQCEIFYDIKDLTNKERKILHQCPELSKYPQLLNLAKYSNNDKYHISSSRYEPHITEGTFGADFSRCANTKQVFRCSLVHIAANAKKNIKPYYAKRLLNNYGNGICRTNMKPPNLIYWIDNQLKQYNSYFNCIVQICTLCIKYLCDVIGSILLLVSIMATMTWIIIMEVLTHIIYFMVGVVNITMQYLSYMCFCHIISFIMALDFVFVMIKLCFHCNESWNKYQRILIVVTITLLSVWISEQSACKSE
eukprot:435122_1